MSNAKETATSNKGTTAKKARRRRKRNEVVDVDIDAPPGDECENWKRIAKLKLAERETKLMTVRLKTLRSVIVEQCTAFETLNSSLHYGTQRVTVPDSSKLIPDLLMTECLDRLSISIKYWNGVNLSKTKRSLNTFRDYYVIARNWFDCLKRNTLGPAFWIKVFRILEQFVIDAAAAYFSRRFNDLQSKYSRHLLFQVLRGIFGAEIHFFEQKVQPLLPGTILKDCDPVKEYLMKLDPALDIRDITQKKKGQDSESKSSRRLSAPEIWQLVNKRLLDLTDDSHLNFQTAFKALWGTINTRLLHTHNSNPGPSHSHSHSHSLPMPMQQQQTAQTVSQSMVHRHSNYHDINHINNNNNNNNDSTLSSCRQQGISASSTLHGMTSGHHSYRIQNNSNLNRKNKVNGMGMATVSRTISGSNGITKISRTVSMKETATFPSNVHRGHQYQHQNLNHHHSNHNVNSNGSYPHSHSNSNVQSHAVTMNGSASSRSGLNAMNPMNASLQYQYPSNVCCDNSSSPSSSAPPSASYPRSTVHGKESMDGGNIGTQQLQSNMNGDNFSSVQTNAFAPDHVPNSNSIGGSLSLQQPLNTMNSMNAMNGNMTPRTSRGKNHIDLSQERFESFEPLPPFRNSNNMRSHPLNNIRNMTSNHGATSIPYGANHSASTTVRQSRFSPYSSSSNGSDGHLQVPELSDLGAFTNSVQSMSSTFCPLLSQSNASNGINPVNGVNAVSVGVNGHSITNNVSRMGPQMQCMDDASYRNGHSSTTSTRNETNHHLQSTGFTPMYHSAANVSNDNQSINGHSQIHNPLQSTRYTPIEVRPSIAANNNSGNLMVNGSGHSTHNNMVPQGPVRQSVDTSNVNAFGSPMTPTTTMTTTTTSSTATLSNLNANLGPISTVASSSINNGYQRTHQHQQHHDAVNHQQQQQFQYQNTSSNMNNGNLSSAVSTVPLNSCQSESTHCIYARNANGGCSSSQYGCCGASSSFHCNQFQCNNH